MHIPSMCGHFATDKLFPPSHRGPAGPGESGRLEDSLQHAGAIQRARLSCVRNNMHLQSAHTVWPPLWGSTPDEAVGKGAWTSQVRRITPSDLVFDACGSKS